MRTSTSSETANWTSSNEAEIPAIIYQTFTALGLERFKIRVNNRKILNGLLRHAGPVRPVRGRSCARWTSWIRSARKRSRPCWWSEWDLAEAAAQEILRFIAITGSNAQVLAALEALPGPEPGL